MLGARWPRRTSRERSSVRRPSQLEVIRAVAGFVLRVEFFPALTTRLRDGPHLLASMSKTELCGVVGSKALAALWLRAESPVSAIARLAVFRAVS
jgi:hypothetical protein